jgi:transketolase
VQINGKSYKIVIQNCVFLQKRLGNYWHTPLMVANIIEQTKFGTRLFFIETILRSQVNNSITSKAANTLRILSAAMVETAKSGHPGGSMGAADFMSILFGEFLRFDPQNPQWIARDRYYQDPGHMSALLYSSLGLFGNYSIEDLKGFRSLGSHTPGHPELDVARGVENTSGPLGMGHAIAMGSALAERFLATRFGSIISHKTYCMISDGGVQEEIAYGVGRLAGHLGLHNLIMYYDANEVQISGKTNDVLEISVVAGMYAAWGWKVLQIDGHNHDEIRQALKEANQETQKPVLIIGKSVIGYGAVCADGSSLEGEASTHGQPISAAGADVAQTIAGLGGNPENPWEYPEAVIQAYSERKVELQKMANEWNVEFSKWQQSNAEQATTLQNWFAGNGPVLDYETLAESLPDNKATRAYSGNVLAGLADLGNVICSSADLACSDNTQSFLDKTTIFRKNDFSGAFLQPGVAELTMASVCNGIALHGGVVPICATFFVFSDYMKPAVRLAALMGLPVKYVWSHDSFRVGEDGPTHQPVEHELQIRLMERMRNLDDKPGMLVLRPADSAETVVAWKMAMENTESPTGLILTRQAVRKLPVLGESSRYQEALQCKRGGYVVSDNSTNGALQLIFLANGSDVSLCEDAAKVLRSQGYAIRVVSLISPNLFMRQDNSYRRSVVPAVGPILGVTSGLPLMFSESVGPLGQVFGLRGFGASANFKVLEEKFGYTTEHLTKLALEYIKEYPQRVATMREQLSSSL